MNFAVGWLKANQMLERLLATNHKRRWFSGGYTRKKPHKKTKIVHIEIVDNLWITCG
jgi:hypothetical protein